MHPNPTSRNPSSSRRSIFEKMSGPPPSNIPIRRQFMKPSTLPLKRRRATRPHSLSGGNLGLPKGGTLYSDYMKPEVPPPSSSGRGNTTLTKKMLSERWKAPLHSSQRQSSASSTLFVKAFDKALREAQTTRMRRVGGGVLLKSSKESRKQNLFSTKESPSSPQDSPPSGRNDPLQGAELSSSEAFFNSSYDGGGGGGGFSTSNPLQVHFPPSFSPANEQRMCGAAPSPHSSLQPVVWRERAEGFGESGEALWEATPNFPSQKASDGGGGGLPPSLKERYATTTSQSLQTHSMSRGGSGGVSLTERFSGGDEMQPPPGGRSMVAGASKLLDARHYEGVGVQILPNAAPVYEKACLPHNLLNPPSSPFTHENSSNPANTPFNHENPSLDFTHAPHHPAMDESSASHPQLAYADNPRYQEGKFSPPTTMVTPPYIIENPSISGDATRAFSAARKFTPGLYASAVAAISKKDPLIMYGLQPEQRGQEQRESGSRLFFEGVGGGGILRRFERNQKLPTGSAVFIRNLPKDISKEKLLQLLEDGGQVVVSVKMERGSFTTALCGFNGIQDAARFEAKHNHQLVCDSHELKVTIVKDLSPHHMRAYQSTSGAEGASDHSAGFLPNVVARESIFNRITR